MATINFKPSEVPEDGIQALFILDPPQLDSETWEKLEEFAEARKIQIWIAKVEENKEKAHIFLVEGVQQASLQEDIN